MALLTRQQAAQSWIEADPTVQIGELLHALEHYKDVSTEYGLNLSVQQGWRFGDTHKKTAAPDRHDYDIKLSDGIAVSPGPQWHNLYRWIISQASEFLSFETVYLSTDTNPGLSHWPVVAAWWKERIKATRWLRWYGVGLASADRLPVVVRIPACPLGSLKGDPPKGNGRRPQKMVERED